MDELFELFIELLLEGLFAILEVIITNKKEKSDLQKWMKRQQEGQILAE